MPLQSSGFLDEQVFLEALNAAPCRPQPYHHFLLENVLPADLVDDVDTLPFQPLDLDYTLGTREEHNPIRRYFNPEILTQYPCAQRVSDIFRHPRILKKIEEKGCISLENSLLRIEYAIDSQNFWLKPHTDVGVKLFTLLIYLSEGPHVQNWGTDIYLNETTHWETVPYQRNTALLFFPSSKTWHGFEPREIQGIRRTLIVNYVTQDWRNRHELTHPTEPVYAQSRPAC